MSHDRSPPPDQPTRTDLPTPQHESTIDVGDVTMTSSPAEGGDCVEERRLHTPAIQVGYERYTDKTILGAGGVGTVSSRLDPNLGRHIAMKELHPHLDGKCEQRIRFFREARVTAQLQHPNIIPVHELGDTPKGSYYFTMKKIKGLSLQQVLQGMRNGSRTMAAEYTRAKLIDIFVDVCQAVAFAHSRQVIHRDLKPENILLGSFGETLVTDWGLVKIIGQDATDEGQSGEMPSTSSVETVNVTMEGSVSGTPLYMSPEQALGKISSLDERSDIYSLGAILYEMLTLERTVEGETLKQVMSNVIAGEIVPPRKRAPKRSIPCDLSAICMKALALDKDDRYPSVSALLQDIRRYQQGLPVSVRPYSLPEKIWKTALRHPVISAVVTAVLVVTSVGAITHVTLRQLRYNEIMRLADNNRLEGTAIYRDRFHYLRELQTEQAKHLDKLNTQREAELEDKLDQLTLRAENAYRTAVMLYALAADGDRSDPNVNTGLSEIFTNRLEYALAAEDWQAAQQWLGLLQRWLGNEYEHAAPDIRHAILQVERRVRGQSQLQIDSQPSGASISMQNLDSMREGNGAAAADMGTTPIPAFSLPKGRYLLTLKHPDRPSIRYPVLLQHNDTQELLIRLPLAIPEGTVYVPEGPFLCGGPHAREFRLHERQENAFFIKQHELTFGEYLVFWRAADRSDPELMSRVQLSRQDRQFVDAWDEAGNLLPPLQATDPIIGISREAAARYCAWLSEQRGREYRLPTAMEWEKAARGVDGRAFVWGNAYHPDYAFTLEHSDADQRYPLMAPPGSFEQDVSLYGAFDLAGNVREWTDTPFPGGSPFYQIKGASFATTKRFLYCSYSSDSPVVPTDVGFRYVVPVRDDLDF